MTDLPSDRNLNPSIQQSQQGPERHVPADKATPFTRAVFPRIVIPYKLLVANLDAVIVEQIQQAAPDTYLAVVVFGAGNKFFREHPTCNADITAFIRTLGVGDDLSNLSIAKAVPRNNPNQKRDFERPWTMVLGGAPQELKEYLVWHQTFAVHPELTFSVLPFDSGLQSWVIMNISGDAVQEGDAAKRDVLGKIKALLWHNPRFRAIADKSLAAVGIAGSCSERAYKATTSFEITYIESNNAQGIHAPIWQLTGRPLSSDPLLHEEFLASVRQQRYWVGLHMLTIDKRIVDCVWCKSNTHPAHACPFPKIPDWLGLVPTAASSALAQAESPTNRGRGRGRGRGSGRGRGGRGDANRGRGGWQYVTRHK
jgi:hypothetical protein